MTKKLKVSLIAIEVILVSVIVQIVFMSFPCLASQNFGYQDIDDDESNKEVNDPCVMKNRMPGICKLDMDCIEVLKIIITGSRDFVSCGFLGLRQIVCCPTPAITTTPTPTSVPPTKAIVITTPRITTPSESDCINKKTGERGIKKFAHYCSELNGEMTDGLDADLCSLDNYELCYDIVCCPIRNSTRLNHKCKLHDDPDYEVKLRINLNLPCYSTLSNDTNALFTTECQLTNIPKVILTETSKVQPQCCPIHSITKFERWDSPEFKYVKVTGRNCTSSRDPRATGECRPHNQCPGARVIDDNACYVNRETQFVCCEYEHQIGSKPDEQACYNFSQDLYTTTYQLVVEPIDFRNRLGMENDGSIISGIISKPTEYPHMAALAYKTAAGKIQFSCSGSLISAEYVLTVAQCLHIYDLSTGTKIPLFKVRLGATSVKEPLNSNDCPEDYDIDQLIPHPDYSDERFYNDIGLVKLKQKVKFSPYVRPICLPTTNTNPSEVFALGYGAISAVSPTNDKLVKILLDTYTPDECKMYMVRPMKQLNRGINAQNQLCAGSRSLLLNACPADAGGSIVTPHASYYETSTLIGLTVYNKLCGFVNNPGIYTLVHPYRDWIERIVWGV